MGGQRAEILSGQRFGKVFLGPQGDFSEPPPNGSSGCAGKANTRRRPRDESAETTNVAANFDLRRHSRALLNPKLNSSERDQTPQPPLAQLTRASLLLRLMGIGAVVTGIAGLFAYAGRALGFFKISGTLKALQSISRTEEHA